MRNLYQATATASRLNRGFTLIELLVVVAIIAILAAIAIPQFNQYRKNAAKAGVLSDARNCLNHVVAGGAATDCRKSPNTASCSASGGNGEPWSVTCTGTGMAAGVSCTASEGGEASCTESSGGGEGGG